MRPYALFYQTTDSGHFCLVLYVLTLAALDRSNISGHNAPMHGLLRRWFGRTEEKSASMSQSLETVARHLETKDLTFEVEIEQESDGRWLAEVTDLPGVMTYGATQDEALKNAYVLTFRVIADRLEHEEARPADTMHFSLVPRECVASR